MTAAAIRQARAGGVFEQQHQVVSFLRVIYFLQGRQVVNPIHIHLRVRRELACMFRVKLRVHIEVHLASSIVRRKI